MARSYRVEDVEKTPRGWRVRTAMAGPHRVRIAYPPGPRKRGSGRVVQILHPRSENPACNRKQLNPLLASLIEGVGIGAGVAAGQLLTGKLLSKNPKPVVRLYRGTALGQEVGLKTWLREATDAPVPPAFLLWGNEQIQVDRSSLDNRLARLVPRGFMGSTTTAKDWEPFIRSALALGKLRGNPESRLFRKSLDQLLKEAATAQGHKLELASTKDRLMYRIDGGTPVSPGEAADALGVKWGLRNAKPGDTIDWKESMVSGLVNSYEGWRGAGLSHDKAVSETLKRTTAGKGARAEFLRRIGKGEHRNPRAMRWVKTPGGRTVGIVMEVQGGPGSRRYQLFVPGMGPTWLRTGRVYDVAPPPNAAEVEARYRAAYPWRFGERNPKGARWMPYFVLKSGVERYGLEHPTQKQAWNEVAQIIHDKKIEWVRDRAVKTYGIMRVGNPPQRITANRERDVARRLSVPEQHQVKIAKQTLRYSDAGARIMGGMTKDEARAFLQKHGIRFKENPKNQRVETLIVRRQLADPDTFMLLDSRGNLLATGTRDYVVAQAKAGGYGIRFEGIRNPNGNGNGNGNGAAAEKLYTDFHGRGPKEVLELQEQIMQAGDYTALGDMGCLWLSPVDAKRDPEDWPDPDIEFEKSDKVKLAVDPSGGQLYLVGGPQEIPLDYLRSRGLDTSKRFIPLGCVYAIAYVTRKKFDEYKEVEYDHAFGDETGELPFAYYDKDARRIVLVGGAYHILPVDERLGASPGLAN